MQPRLQQICSSAQSIHTYSWAQTMSTKLLTSMPRGCLTPRNKVVAVFAFLLILLHWPHSPFSHGKRALLFSNAFHLVWSWWILLPLLTILHPCFGMNPPPQHTTAISWLLLVIRAVHCQVSPTIDWLDLLLQGGHAQSQHSGCDTDYNTCVLRR